MSRGIRGRITSLSAAAVFVVLVTAAVALVTAQREIVTDSVDEVLDRHAVTVGDGRHPSGRSSRADDVGETAGFHR